MKKVFVILAVAASAMVLFSCDKTKKEPIKYDTPIYNDMAVKYDVDALSEVASGISSFETTNTGIYVIEEVDGRVISGEFQKTSMDPDNHTADLFLEGYGAVKIRDDQFPAFSKADNNVILEFKKDGSLIPITVTAEAIPSTSGASEAVMSDLCRTWKVTATELVISEYKISKTFDGGCDIPAILKYLEGKISGFKADKDYAGYVVKDLTLTDKSIIVRFNGADAFSAPMKIDANLGFEYQVSGAQVGNPIFNGEAKGRISFDDVNKPIVSISAVIKDNGGKEYNGSVKFYLEEVKPAN